MLISPKSSNRFASDDVEGCVKCSSTWIPMFSFETDVPQTGQIDKEGGRSMSCRYNSSRRLFISTGADLDHEDITASISKSCFRFERSFKDSKKNWNTSDPNDFPGDHDLPPVESHQALRSSLNAKKRQILETQLCHVPSRQIRLRYCKEFDSGDLSSSSR